jgi:hypothetical protein
MQLAYTRPTAGPPRIGRGLSDFSIQPLMTSIPLLILIRANLRIAQPAGVSTFVPDKAFKNTELSQQL